MYYITKPIIGRVAAAATAITLLALAFQVFSSATGQ